VTQVTANTIVPSYRLIIKTKGSKEPIRNRSDQERIKIMKTTITTLVAAAAIAVTMGAVSQTASAETASVATAPIVETSAAKNGGTVNVGRRFRYGFNRFNYSYRPVYVCKRHYRWVLTRVGWRQVYVGYRCGYSNNY
jgi:phosphate-selective porin